MKPLMIMARVLAIVIAVVAFIDPSVTSERRSKPLIALLTAGYADGAGYAENKTTFGFSSARSTLSALPAASSAVIQTVSTQLARDYTVIRAPYPGAAATVIVGDQLPANASELASPVFAFVPNRVGPAVTIENVAAPATSSLEARVPLIATTRVSGARGTTLVVSLMSGGLVVVRATRAISTDDERISVPLSFAAAATGTAALRVVARIGTAGDSAAADVAIDVRDKRWAVLFFDRRPSWTSTFVRRALENDRRFVVASRVVTSQSISTNVGRPPSSLDDPTLLELYDAIVVGAPETLTAGDAAGLEAFLRRRGGSVVLLFDERPGMRGTGAYEKLTNVGRWDGATTSTPTVIEPSPADSGGLRATELMWPVAMPIGGEVLAHATADQPIVWSSSVGAGQLIVSGALDAWRFRDATTSQFDGFWRSTIARSAESAMSPMDVRVGRSVVEPGEMIDVDVTVRDAVLADPTQSIHTSVGGAIEQSAIRFWPTGVGTFGGVVRAPTSPGEYRVSVAANGSSVDVPIVVTRTVARAMPDDHEIVDAWVGAHGGSVVRPDQIPTALASVVKAPLRMAVWHPMRSAWWLWPFVLLLAGEWWWRRRQGLA